MSGKAEDMQRWPLGKEVSSSATNPLQNTTESISKAGGVSREMRVKKDRKSQTERRGNKRSEIQQREHQEQQRRKSSILEQTSRMQPNARTEGHA